MKILSIATFDIWPLGKGKGIPSVFASQKGFVQAGHEVYYLCPLKRKDLPQHENYEGIHIFRFKLPFGLSTLTALSMRDDTFIRRIGVTIYYNFEWLFFQICGFYWLLKFTRQFRPDIIYVHTATPAAMAFIAGRIFDTRLVMRIYGLKDLYSKWHSFWYRIKESRDYLSLKIPMDYYIVTNDGTNAHRLLEALGVASEKVKHWRNGVDFNMYNPSEQNRIDVCRMLNIDTRSKIVISTSRIMHHYGSDILVKALSRVCRQRDDVVGVIIGEGPQKQSLQEHVLASHLENKIFFTGLLDREELSKFLNAADIFVLLSRFNNCTNTMWEAMVCGKCIITTENNNIKEVLTSGENAILIAPDGLYRFGEILSSIIADEFLQKRLGECARKRALEILESWPKRIKKEIKLIETLSNNT